ncbi:hypothetical protein [Marinobacter sp.]|uniref:hypothetical protein n=1 Tax=Marinobacter sp. TaxID=50741 RepID=UPI00384E04E4
MRQPDSTAVLFPLGLLIVTLMMSACASRDIPEPAPRGEPAPAPEIPQPREQEKPAVRQVPPPERATCAWSRIRGVATLLALTETPDPPRGTWQFFPGDDIVFHPVPAGASEGDEFKALLQRPMSGPCRDSRMVLFGPL